MLHVLACPRAVCSWLVCVSVGIFSVGSNADSSIYLGDRVLTSAVWNWSRT